MSHHWIPTKKETEDCLDRKIHEFAVQENRNPRLTDICTQKFMKSYFFLSWLNYTSGLRS